MTGFISILIITYNRPADLLALLHSLRDQQDLSAVKEVLLLNNASTESYQEVEEFVNYNTDLGLRYISSPTNLGVSRGRNQLMKEAKGEWLLVLDDDVVFATNNDMAKIAQLPTKKFFIENNTAIITFRVIYYETKQVQLTAFPHKRFNEYKDLPNFLTYYFTGCAHFLKREILEKTGYYPEDFFYGMEEYDLSYRVINSGYSLGYDNEVTIEHKESPKGRQPNYQKLASQWINKSKVAYRYLPTRFYWSTAFAWSLQFLLHATTHLGTFFSSWRKTLSIPQKEQKHTITRQAIQYLHKVKARLWY